MEKWYSEELNKHLKRLLRPKSEEVLRDQLNLLKIMAEGGNPKIPGPSGRTYRSDIYPSLPDEYFVELIKQYNITTKNNNR